MNIQRVYITRTALKTMRNQIHVTQNRIETGGVLMGYYSQGNEVVVTHASSPGHRAIQKRRSVIFDSEFCQEFVNDVFTNSSGYFTYIGDWHSHTLHSLKPSFTDRRELTKMVKSREKHFPPIMLIAFATDSEFLSSVFSLSRDLYQIPKIKFLEYDIHTPIKGR